MNSELDHRCSSDPSSHPPPWSEGGRFQSPPMCSDLTGECARRFLADLDPPEKRIAEGTTPGKGPDSLLRDIATGSIESAVLSAEEAQEILDSRLDSGNQ